jgi:hypothetical protein
MNLNGQKHVSDVDLVDISSMQDVPTHVGQIDCLYVVNDFHERFSSQDLAHLFIYGLFNCQ